MTSNANFDRLSVLAVSKYGTPQLSYEYKIHFAGCFTINYCDQSILCTCSPDVCGRNFVVIGSVV